MRLGCFSISQTHLALKAYSSPSESFCFSRRKFGVFVRSWDPRTGFVPMVGLELVSLLYLSHLIKPGLPTLGRCYTVLALACAP